MAAVGPVVLRRVPTGKQQEYGDQYEGEQSRDGQAVDKHHCYLFSFGAMPVTVAGLAGCVGKGLPGSGPVAFFRQYLFSPQVVTLVFHEMLIL
jgi:hypothetical protein